MRILVLGHKGLLGSSLISLLGADFTDLRFPSPEFINFITRSNYDVIVNCAVNKINDKVVNVDLPTFLSASCNYLVQFSSDAVFSGLKPHNLKYDKTDLVDPDTIYGQQKVMMEQSLIGISNSLIIRTSFIDQKSPFVQNILSQPKFLAFTNYLWSGLTAKQVSLLTLSCIKNNKTGLCHMFSNRTQSKYQLAKKVACCYNTQTEIIPVDYPSLNRQITSDFNINFNITDL